MEHIYDVLIVGGGPAGLAAGIYAARSRLDTLLVEKSQPGGQIALTAELENYPGQLLEGETGLTLSRRMAEQGRRLGLATASDAILRAELAGPVKRLEGEKGAYQARSLIIAAGAAPRPIGCENEEQFVGAGISYCATCDGAFFKGLEVYVAGGGDSAVEEAIFLTRFARHVTIIHRRDRLRASRGLQERAFANEKISFLWNSAVTRAMGEGVLSAIAVQNVKTGEETVLRASPADGLLGLFGFTGHLPNTGPFADALALEDGYIRTDDRMATSIPGVFAAGDIRAKAVRQVVTAAADGAIAAISAERFLTEGQV